jgi:hypothetical protein
MKSLIVLALLCSTAAAQIRVEYSPAYHPSNYNRPRYQPRPDYYPHYHYPPIIVQERGPNVFPLDMRGYLPGPPAPGVVKNTPQWLRAAQKRAAREQYAQPTRSSSGR